MKIIKYVKVKMVFLILFLLSITNNLIVYASGNEAAEELKKILTNDSHTGLMDIVQSAGWLILAFGIGQMILAFKDDNADSKAKGSMVTLAGVFCITIKLILKTLGAL